MAAIVDRALAAEPDARWPDARAMQKVVRDARALATKRAGEVVRRRRNRVGVVLTAFAVGGAALATSVFAPAKLRDVGKAVTSFAPALVGADASAPALAETTPPRATSAPAPRSSAAPRAKPVPHPRATR